MATKKVKATKKATKKVAPKKVASKSKPAKLTKENRVKEVGEDPCDCLVYETPGVKITAKAFKAGVLLHHAYADHSSSIFLPGARVQQVGSRYYKIID